VKKPVAESVKFARLEDCGTMKVKDVVTRIQGNQSCDQSHDLMYLFDWSLPCHCPQLAEELIIPKYFAGNYFK